MYKLSPCTGICSLNKSTSYCIGCLRTPEEIAKWRSLDYNEQRKLWLEVGQRRSEIIEPQLVRDQVKREIYIKSPIKKIVSLVPSITQTLYDLGLEDKVVGITNYCPKGDRKKRVVGGTKNIRIKIIDELNPGLILGAKEENTLEVIELLEKNHPVFVFDIVDFKSAFKMLDRLGEILNCQKDSLRLREKIQDGLNNCKGITNKSCAYFIWKDPYMVAGSNTFINTWLEHIGFENIFSKQSRYPELTTCPKDLKADTIFLPDEPYNFNQTNLSDFKGAENKAKVYLIDGKCFSWFGSYMLKSTSIIKSFIN